MSQGQDTRKRKTKLLTAVGTVWLLAVAAGFGLLSVYASAPGETGTPSARWPDASTLARRAGEQTLVMVAHARCPCTRASIAELEQILSRTRSHPRTYVLFVPPADAEGDAEWMEESLAHRAAAIVGVEVVRDELGEQARLFAVSTSGHTLLYDEEGVLQFSGGITSSRGHEGENAGRAAILALINRESPQTRSTPVFGCSLPSADAPHAATMECCQ